MTNLASFGAVPKHCEELFILELPPPPPLCTWINVLITVAQKINLEA